jgi:hypothetical protein
MQNTTKAYCIILTVLEEAKGMKKTWAEINLLTTKDRLLYLKTQFVPRSKHFSSRLQKPTIYRYIGENSLFVVR